MTIITLVRLRRALLVAIVVLGLVAAAAAADRLDRIALPPGFTIEVFSDAVPGARSMALSPAGTLFVGTREKGVVYAIPDAVGTTHAATPRRIARGLTSPNGVAVRDGALYVAEISRIIRFDDIEARLEHPPAPVVVTDRFPTDRHHGWKFIAFGPDGMLYVPVGAPCNICRPDERHGVIDRMKADGSGLQVFAAGIRNSVGFDWHPATQELWFTDNGVDDMGDDIPPDELNHAPRPGMDFGFPDCLAGTIPSPEFNKEPCNKFTPPAINLGPHVAAI